MLLWTLANESTYLNLIYLATSLILLPYLWSAAYQVLLAVRGETYETGHGRTRDLVVGVVGPGVRRMAGLRGWLGVPAGRRRCSTCWARRFYVWARRESQLPVFTSAEKVAGRRRRAGRRSWPVG